MSTIIPFPGTEESPVDEIETVYSCLFSYGDFWKIVGTGSWRGLLALADVGGIRSSGRLSIRPHHRSKEVIAEWGFDFRQIESPKKGRFKFLFEVGNESGSVSIPLTLSNVNGRRSESLTCPHCKVTPDDWFLVCISNYGWACENDCHGLKLRELGVRPESARVQLRMDTEVREHSIELPRAYRNSVEITRIHKTTFFYERPELFAMLPGIFQVRALGRNETIGHFVADSRHMPVIESKQVQVLT